jgi:hypothetical protein
MTRQLPFGTAHAEVLLKLTAAKRKEPVWRLKDGDALYDENRALTDAVCQGLVRHGFLDEKLEDNSPVYTVTKAGKEKASELRGRKSPTSR